MSSGGVRPFRFDLAGIVISIFVGIEIAAAYVIGKRGLTLSIIGPIIINVLVEPWLFLFIITMYSRMAQA